MMRTDLTVLHVLNELRFSGAEVMLKTAAPYWKQAGIRGDILAKGEEEGAYSKLLQKAGYEIIHEPYKGYKTFLSQYRTLLERRHYDVVHIHTEQLSCVLAVVASWVGIPAVVRTIHSSFSHAGKSRLKRVIQRAFLRCAGVQQVSISPTVESTEQNFLWNQTLQIPNWFDSNTYVPPDSSERRAAREHFSIAQDEFVIVSVGNCAEVKNHSALLRAMNRLCDPKIVYLHVGEEEPDYPERSLAHDLGILDQAHFLGPQKNVRKALYAGDVFAMPSLREGLGIAALEAMGSGLTAILTDVPGLRDHQDLGDGVFVTEPTPKALAQTIRQVQTLSEKERRQMGHELSENVQRRHGIETGAALYAKLYHGTLELS